MKWHSHQNEGNGNRPVRCQDDWAAIFDDACDAVPQESTSLGVHSSGWLILTFDKFISMEDIHKQQLLREPTRNMMGGLPTKAMAVDSFLLLPPESSPANFEACRTSPNLRTPHSATWKTISQWNHWKWTLGPIKGPRISHHGNILLRNPSETSIQGQMLFRCQERAEGIKLWTVSQVLVDTGHLRCNTKEMKMIKALWDALTQSMGKWYGFTCNQPSELCHWSLQGHRSASWR